YLISMLIFLSIGLFVAIPDIRYLMFLLTFGIILHILPMISIIFLKPSKEGQQLTQKPAFLFFYFVVFCLILATAPKYRRMEIYRIPSLSNFPNLIPGDQIIVDNWEYSENTPTRGDVVVFTFPEDGVSKKYIKRVVGMPGDTLEIIDNHLYVNSVDTMKEALKSDDIARLKKLSDQAQSLDINSSSYIEPTDFNEESLEGKNYVIALSLRDPQDVMSNYGPIKVPKGNYFVLGDNRLNSLDSRLKGMVPLKNIIAKAKYLFMNSPNQGEGTYSIDTQRIGKWIK
ncbi:MAG: signal peptidase I, partial [Bdellovibrionales bacterium]|nr:signal peptidase I [Bdellovibrionales bacterium]